jgi:hypothetical protein
MELCNAWIWYANYCYVPKVGGGGDVGGMRWLESRTMQL